MTETIKVIPSGRIKRTTKVEYEVYDYAYNNTYDTLKEAKKEYKDLAIGYNMAKIVKKVTEITSIVTYETVAER